MERKFDLRKIYRVAEVKLTYKTKIKPCERPVIIQAEDAFKIFLLTWDKDRIDLQEQFKILLLNRINSVLGICELSTGGVASTDIDARLIFSAALKAHAFSIILCHNHPSGSVTPSKADIMITERLKKAGEILCIKVLDHLVISSDTYFSFADEGLL